MAYRDFTFPEVLATLGLRVTNGVLFPAVLPCPLPGHLLDHIAEGVVLSQGIDNEKSRSEFIVAPLLLELRRMTGRGFGLFSGVSFDVDAGRNLNGFCDFLLTREPQVLVLTPPVVAIVEAKNDHVQAGYGQCIAMMRAAQLFNEQTKCLKRVVFGAATTGLQWKFLRIEQDVVTIDDSEYFINLPDVLAGVLLHILGLKPVAPQGATA